MWRKGLTVARMLGRASFALLVLAFVLLVAGVAAGARVNVTRSLPPGLYWAVDRPIERHAYVRFCPPKEGPFALAMERGYLSSGGACPEGFPMIKRVVGLAGDSVEAVESGVSVNGQMLPSSAFRRTDGLGRPMPRPPCGERRLRASELWVMSDTNERSFDSRYFGPIDRAWVKEVIVPVLTWGPGGTLAGGP
jgi:conjugative transfer signal peptidase TraF